MLLILKPQRQVFSHRDANGSEEWKIKSERLFPLLASVIDPLDLKADPEIIIQEDGVCTLI